MKQGCVIFWNKERRFGFIETRTPVANGGYEVQKFYFNQTYLKFTTVDEIGIGNAVRFEVKDVPRRTQSDVPVAVNCELFKDVEQLRTYAMLTERAAGSEVKS